MSSYLSSEIFSPSKIKLAQSGKQALGSFEFFGTEAVAVQQYFFENIAF